MPKKMGGNIRFQQKMENGLATAPKLCYGKKIKPP
jgi:hypothetical protein